MNQQAKQSIKPKRKPEKIFLRVIRGGLIPADNFAETQLRNKKFKVGDVVGAEIRKLRSHGLNRHAHKIAILCHRNIDEFSNYTDMHLLLKRLQIESGAACDEVGVKLAGMWCTVRQPRSFSFEQMDESEFRDAVKVICRYISKEYWISLTPEEIEDMSSAMMDE